MNELKASATIVFTIDEDFPNGKATATITLPPSTQTDVVEIRSVQDGGLVVGNMNFHDYLVVEGEEGEPDIEKEVWKAWDYDFFVSGHPSPAQNQTYECAVYFWVYDCQKQGESKDQGESKK